jgi:hypothetical protein
MSSDEISRRTPLHRKSRAKRQKKETSYKTEWPPDYPGPTLLLRMVQSTPGKFLATKPCTICKQIKPVSEFFTNKKPGRPLSYRSQCKKCHCSVQSSYQKQKKWDAKRRLDPARSEYLREYRKRNRDKFKEYHKRHVEKHPDFYKKVAQRKAERNRKLTQQAEGALNDKDCV